MENLNAAAMEEVMKFATVVVMGILLLGCFVPANAQALPKDCSSLVVNRTFAFSFHGVLNAAMYFNSLGVTPPPGMGIMPTGGAGYFAFLPNGRVDGKVTVAMGGLQIVQDAGFDAGSSYTLTWDNTRTICSGTAVQITAGLAPLHFQLIVSQSRQQIELLHLDTGLIVNETASAIDMQGCNINTLRGMYTYNSKGWTLVPPELNFPPEQLLAGYAPFVMSGAMTFDPSFLRPPTPGAGVVSFWDTVAMNGIIAPRTGSGWYKIRSDCTGTMQLTDSLGNAFQLELFVAKDGTIVHGANLDTITVPGAPSPIPVHPLGWTLTRLDQ